MKTLRLLLIAALVLCFADHALAQAVEQAVQATKGAGAEPATKVFGLTVLEWSILLGALGTFLEALRQRHGKMREGKKVQAVIEALEEVGERHPDLTKTAKKIVRDKATRMGVQTSLWGLDGLHDQVTKQTTVYKKDKIEEDKYEKPPTDKPPSADGS